MNTLSKFTHDMAAKTVPGISGYGQQGAMGFTGEDGNKTYFSIYTDDKKILTNVQARLSLDGFDKETTYSKNDLIIARDGKIWTVSNDTGTAIALSQNIFSSSIKLDFTVDKPDDDDVSHTNIIENPYYMHQYARHNSSPWMCHRDRYSPVNAGCWFKFEVSTKHIDGMSYRCGAILPNGNVIESADFTIGTGSDDHPTCYLFIDSRYILETHPVNDRYEAMSIDGYRQGACMFDIIRYNGVDNHEYDSAIGDLVRTMAKRDCVFFVTAESTSTGKTYMRERKYNGT